MQSTTVIDSDDHRLRGGIWTRIRRILFKNLWLPRIIYESLPYVYVLMGLFALLSGMYLPDGTWIVPYVVLLGLFCLHAGLGVATLRYRHARRRRERD